MCVQVLGIPMKADAAQSSTLSESSSSTSTSSTTTTTPPVQQLGVVPFLLQASLSESSVLLLASGIDVQLGLLVQEWMNNSWLTNGYCVLYAFSGVPSVWLTHASDSELPRRCLEEINKATSKVRLDLYLPIESDGMILHPLLLFRTNRLNLCECVQY